MKLAKREGKLGPAMLIALAQSMSLWTRVRMEITNQLFYKLNLYEKEKYFLQNFSFVRQWLAGKVNYREGQTWVVF